MRRHPVLLKRCEYKHIFVPIRSMQFIAVIDDKEIIFVDSLNYAVRDGEGGRMIMMAWEFDQEGVRDSLSAPVSVDLIHYALDGEAGVPESVQAFRQGWLCQPNQLEIAAKTLGS